MLVIHGKDQNDDMILYLFHEFNSNYPFLRNLNLLAVCSAIGFEHDQ